MKTRKAFGDERPDHSSEDLLYPFLRLLVTKKLHGTLRTRCQACLAGMNSVREFFIASND